MEDNAAVKSAPQRRTGALVLNSTQVGLVLGFVVVGVIAALGVGFIVGMWYQASEHITPYEDRPAPMAEEPSESQGMTFYSTLTARDAGTASPTASAPSAAKPAPGASETANRLPARPVAPPPPAKAGERPSPPTGWSPPASSVSPSAPAVARRDAGAPEGANRLSARVVTPSPPRTGEPTPPPGGDPAPPEKSQMVAVPAPPRLSGVAYSVQVGSFRSPEQAEQLRSRLVQKGYPARVQTSVLPDKGVWYRVRVGYFPDRTSADQTAHRLTVQERISAIVTDEK